MHVPLGVVSRSLRTLEALMRSNAFATWDEAELMEVSMTAARGTADAEALGVRPKRMAAVLGDDLTRKKRCSTANVAPFGLIEPPFTG